MDLQVFRYIANTFETLNHCLNFFVFCMASSEYTRAFLNSCPCVRNHLESIPWCSRFLLSRRFTVSEFQSESKIAILRKSSTMQRDSTIDKNINRRNTAISRRDSTVSPNQKKRSTEKLLNRRNTTVVFLEDSSTSKNPESPVEKFFNRRKKEVLGPERNPTVSTIEKDSIVGKLFDRRKKSTISLRKDSAISKTQDSIVTLNQDSLIEEFFSQRKTGAGGLEKNSTITKIQDLPINIFTESNNNIVDFGGSSTVSTNENIFSISRSSPLSRSIQTVGFYSIGTASEFVKPEKTEDCLVIKNESVDGRKSGINMDDFQEGDELL